MSTSAADPATGITRSPATNGRSGTNGTPRAHNANGSDATSLAGALPLISPGEGTLQELSGSLKMFSRTLQVVTDSRVEIYNVTDRVKDLVKASGVKAGFLVLSTLHTTTAIFINEFQAALMADVKHFLERIASAEHGYLHNCEDCSDCERKNAEAHIRALVLGHNVTLPIQDGKLPLGQWQSILFAELDGPRKRTVTAQVIGV